MNNKNNFDKKYCFTQAALSLFIVFLIYGSIFVFLLVPLTTFADTASEYQNAQEYILYNNLSDQLSNSVNQKNIPVSVNNNPSETQYYNNPNGIAGAAGAIVTTPNSAGNIVQSNALSRPKYTVNTNSPEIQTGELIQQNATQIAEGTYKDCNEKSTKKVVYTNETCQTAMPVNFQCTRNLTVSVQKEKYNVDDPQNLSGRVSQKWLNSQTVHVDPSTGSIKSISMHVRNEWNIWSCSQTYYLSINGIQVAQYHGSCGNRLGDLQFDANNLSIPFSSNNFVISVSPGLLFGTFTGTVTLSVQQEKNVATDNWVSSCINPPTQCQIKSLCTDPNSTKTIANVPITRACWSYEDIYQCGGQQSDTCAALQNNGCTQISSQCLSQDNGLCTQYSQTWSCPKNETVGSGIVCGQHFYCMDGNCQKTDDEKNTDFGKSVTQLAAVSSAASDVKNQNVNPATPYQVSMFTGQEAECRVDAVGFENCCSDTGWGNGILANCSDSEKHLGQAKEQGVVVATGEYCRHKFLGVCVEHRKTYCIFPGKLAYDVQVYGRQDQLGRNFGNGKNTNCSGISPNDIKNINFSKINFSNVISDVENQKTLPNPTQNQSEISNLIANQAGAQNPSPYQKGGL